MAHGRNNRTMAQALLVTAGLGLLGCISAENRNLTSSIVVTTTPALTEGETRLALELHQTREEMLLSDVDTFLESDSAPKLSHAVRSQLLERCRALRLTLPRARQEFADGLALVQPDAGKSFGDGNMVIYIAGKSAVHVLFSPAEVGQLLAFKECADDLTTLRYSHREFDSARLRALRDRVAAQGLNVPNLEPSKSELEKLKTEAATRVLDRYLRDAALPLPNDLPLLTSGILQPARSPKLTAALSDPSVIERILKDRDPDVLRALVFLINRDVIELSSP